MIKPMIVLMLLPLMLAFAGCGKQAPESETEAAMTEQTAEKETRTYAVDGMHCSGCESRLEYTVQKLPQVSEATASHDEKKLVVVVDKNLSDEEIVTKIREAELTPGERIQ